MPYIILIYAMDFNDFRLLDVLKSNGNSGCEVAQICVLNANSPYSRKPVKFWEHYVELAIQNLAKYISLKGVYSST